MKVAVTSAGRNLDAQVDPRFGRCKYFMFIQLDEMSFEAVENPSVGLGGGAGVQSAQMVAGNGAEVVITGNCGPNAFATLKAAGISVVVGASGTVREAAEKFKNGELSPAGDANVQSHFGMGGGGGGMGGGMGRGRGQGGNS